MVPDSLISRLQSTFTYHAYYHAQRYGLEACDVEQQMWCELLARGSRVVHRCGPLLSQRNAYIATWAVREALRRLGTQRGSLEIVPLDDASRASAPPATGAGGFAEYLLQIGREWQIDVSIAVETVRAIGVSLEFEMYIRSLEPKDRRIAALLLSGVKRTHIEKQKLAGRTQTQQIRSELIQILKAA